MVGNKNDLIALGDLIQHDVLLMHFYFQNSV